MPILAIAAFDTYGMRLAAIEALRDDYIYEQVDADEFVRVLRRIP